MFDELCTDDGAVKFIFSNNKAFGWICAPIGGFGNHIRWMLTLDTKIQAELYDSRVDQFWPYYSINDKLTYISTYVYGTSRTWHNWLHTEWLYRTSLNKVIPFEHHYIAESEITSTYKGILCTVSSDLALRCYLKINSSLNNKTIDGFRLSITRINREAKTYARLNNCLCLNADILYTEVLDRDFYTSMINYLGFDNNYESAALIHAQWYQLHQRAEQEFVTDITNFYRPEPNNNIGKTLNTAIGL
jgi:hypothetical protein